MARRLTEAVGLAVDEHGLRPVAVALTHGHLDHTASVAARFEQILGPRWTWREPEATGPCGTAMFSNWRVFASPAGWSGTSPDETYS